MKQYGFTLLELMIVVVVIGILAMIAVPTYIGYTERARRTAAINALQTVAYREEGYFGRHNVYTSDLTELGYDNAASVLTDEGFYKITVAVPTSTEYTITATPQKGQATDDCGTFTLNSLGVKNAGQPDCWPS